MQNRHRGEIFPLSGVRDPKDDVANERRIVLPARLDEPLHRCSWTDELAARILVHVELEGVVGIKEWRGFRVDDFVCAEDGWV